MSAGTPGDYDYISALRGILDAIPAGETLLEVRMCDQGDESEAGEWVPGVIQWTVRTFCAKGKTAKDSECYWDEASGRWSLGLTSRGPCYAEEQCVCFSVENDLLT